MFKSLLCLESDCRPPRDVVRALLSLNLPFYGLRADVPLLLLMVLLKRGSTPYCVEMRFFLISASLQRVCVGVWSRSLKGVTLFILPWLCDLTRPLSGLRTAGWMIMELLMSRLKLWFVCGRTVVAVSGRELGRESMYSCLASSYMSYDFFLASRSNTLCEDRSLLSVRLSEYFPVLCRFKLYLKSMRLSSVLVLLMSFMSYV